MIQWFRQLREGGSSSSSGVFEEAVLDVSTRDAASGRPIYVDTMVTCAHCDYAPRQQGRANRDGVAAEDAVRVKRRRYPPEGGELIPLVFESGGRPAEETVTYIRSLGASVGDPVERSMLTRALWQQYACTLQCGNAEMLLSAVG